LMAKTTVDNIPATGKARTEAEDEARKKIVRRYERFVRDKMGQITSARIPRAKFPLNFARF
jgi:hypothetical protein